MRRRLIAHDDLTEIEPRIVASSVGHEGVSDRLIISMAISNKCLAYPVDFNSVEKIRNHVSAALKGVLGRLCEDMGAFRKIQREHPDQAREARRYSEELGKIEIQKGGVRLTLPNPSTESWLDVPEPDFSSIHNGFHYEEVRIQMNFHRPDEIQLPDGGTIKITP